MDPTEPTAPDLRETLRRAGFESSCEACRNAVARGQEACAPHYVPVPDRARFEAQRKLARDWFRVPALAERERRKRDDVRVLRLERDDD